MAKKTLQDLQYEFDGLLKGAKRDEQLKGSRSKYYPVFKARGMKGLKDGGPIIKRKSPGKTTSPKVKKIMQDTDWMKGLSKDQLKEMMSGPHVGGERRAKVKKKPSKVRKAKAGGPVVKKMGGGSLKDIPAGNKGLSKLSKGVRKEMGFKKAGGPVSKKMGGGKVYKYKHGTGNKTIMSMDSKTVAGCYPGFK